MKRHFVGEEPQSKRRKIVSICNGFPETMNTISINCIVDNNLVEPMDICIQIPDSTAWISIDEKCIRGTLIVLSENKVRIVIGLLSKIKSICFKKVFAQLENELFEKKYNLSNNGLNIIMRENKFIIKCIRGNISHLNYDTILNDNPYIHGKTNFEILLNNTIQFYKNKSLLLEKWIYLFDNERNNYCYDENYNFNVNNNLSMDLLSMYLKYMNNYIEIELLNEKNNENEIEKIKLMFHYYLKKNDIWHLMGMNIENGAFKSKNFYVGGESGLGFDWGWQYAIELTQLMPPLWPVRVKNIIGVYVHGEQEGNWKTLKRLWVRLCRITRLL